MKGSKSSLWIVVGIWCASSVAIAGEAVWTGLGADDRWSNPANWQGGVLPASQDNIVFEPGVDWYDEYSLGNRQVTVTIDGTARANDLVFYHYGALNWPFQDITVLPGADFSLNNEYIDQMVGTYNQTGGEHLVNGDFGYATYGGSFNMQGGTFTIGGTLRAGPEQGDFRITGGTVTAQRLEIGINGWGTSFSIGGTADVHIIDELCLNYNDWTTLSFNRPIYMEGADFVNKHGVFPEDVAGIKDMRLIFDGGLADISTFEVAGGDYGADLAGFVDNYAINELRIGDVEPGYIQLVDAINNYEDYLIPGNEALYVDTLVMGNGSILDLNGYNLYTLDGLNPFQVEPGPWGDGMVVPEPTTLLLLGLGCLALRRKCRAK